MGGSQYDDFEEEGTFDDETEVDEDLGYGDVITPSIPNPTTSHFYDEDDIQTPVINFPEESHHEDEEGGSTYDFEKLLLNEKDLSRRPKDIMNKLALGMEEFQDLLFQVSKITAVAKEVSTAVSTLSKNSNIFITREEKVVEAYGFIIQSTSKLRGQIGDALAEVRGVTTDAATAQAELKSWLSRTQQSIGVIHKDLGLKIENVINTLNESLEETLNQIADKVQVDEIKESIAKQINAELSKLPTTELKTSAEMLQKIAQEINAEVTLLGDHSNKDSILMRLKNGIDEMSKVAKTYNKKQQITYFAAAIFFGISLGAGVSIATGSYFDREFIKQQVLSLELEKMKIAEEYGSVSKILSPDFFPNKDFSFIEINGKKYLQVSRAAKPTPSQDGTSFLFALTPQSR